MPSLLDSPPQIPAAGACWGSLYVVEEPVKPRHVVVVPAAAVAKQPAYGGRKKNLELCTEALGCETAAVDAAACNGADDDMGDAEVEAERAERKRRARQEEEMAGGSRPLPPPLTTMARGASRVRMVHERRDGRLAVYAVRAPGIEAERSGGRLRIRMRLVSLPVKNKNRRKKQRQMRSWWWKKRSAASPSMCAAAGAWNRKVPPPRRGAASSGSRSRLLRSGSPAPEQNQWISPPTAY